MRGSGKLLQSGGTLAQARCHRQEVGSIGLGQANLSGMRARNGRRRPRPGRARGGGRASPDGRPGRPRLPEGADRRGGRCAGQRHHARCRPHFPGMGRARRADAAGLHRAALHQWPEPGDRHGAQASRSPSIRAASSRACCCRPRSPSSGRPSKPTSIAKAACCAASSRIRARSRRARRWRSWSSSCWPSPTTTRCSASSTRSGSSRRSSRCATPRRASPGSPRRRAASSSATRRASAFRPMRVSAAAAIRSTSP